MIGVPKVVVDIIRIADCEDPDLYAAAPLYQWEKSAKGSWIMTNSLTTPEWHKILSPDYYGWLIKIEAEFDGPLMTEYLLRWG